MSRILHPSFLRDRMPFVLMFVLAMLPFSTSLSPHFVRDDEPLIRDNTLLQTWSGIGAWMLRPFWAVPVAMESASRDSPYYRPMCSLAYGVTAQLFGQSNALPFRLFDIVLHAANALLLFVFSRRLAHAFGASAAVPFLLVLVWAWHPQRIESVANATGVTDTLMTFALGLCTFTLWRHPRTRRHEALASVLALVAFLSKEAAILLTPLLLFVHAATRASDETSWLLRAKSSLQSVFARGLALSLLLTMVLRQQAQVAGVQIAPAKVGAQLFAASLWRYFGTAFSPLPWSTFRDPVVATAAGSNISPAFSLAGWLLLALLVVLAVVLAVWARKASAREPNLANVVYLTLILSAFAFLALIPVLHVTVQRTTSLISDRFTYAPQALLALAATGPMVLLYRRASRLTRQATLAGASLLLTMVLVITAVEAQHLSSNRALWTQELAVNPANELAIDGLLGPAILSGEYNEALRLAELGGRLPASSRIHAAVFQVYGVTAAIAELGGRTALTPEEQTKLAQASEYFARLNAGGPAEFVAYGTNQDGRPREFRFSRLQCDEICVRQLRETPLFWEMWSFAHQHLGQLAESVLVLERAEPYRRRFDDPELRDRSYRLLAVAYARVGRMENANDAAQAIQVPELRQAVLLEIREVAAAGPRASGQN